MSEQQQDHAGDILIVDDTPANLQVLSHMLKKEGYKVRPVPSGELALKAATNQAPDMVLLDINMPKMDGYEVCRRFKASDELSGIPVLFISALSEPLDKIKAFAAGGVDYVTKPFQLEEVRARVATHLRLRRLQLELEAKNRALQESYEQLQELESMRDSLTHMIVHDMRSPLTGIVSSMQFLDEDVAKGLPEESRRDIEQAIVSGRRLASMINDLLDINRMESGEMPLDIEEADLVAVADAAVGSLGGLKRDRNLRLELPEEGLRIACDRELMQRVFTNLMCNALKFTPVDGEVVFSLVRDDSDVRFSVRDTGPGIPEPYRDKIFEKFGQVQARKARAVPSTGLGLAFCKMAVEAHGGQIGVESELGKGSLFWGTIPSRD